MFACLYVPLPLLRPGLAPRLAEVARLFSPRVDARAGHLVTLDIKGLHGLFGDDRAVGDRLRRAAADHGFVAAHVAIAGTRTAAMLLAASRAGVTVAPSGEEAVALAPLPLCVLAAAASRAPSPEPRPSTPLGAALNVSKGRVPSRGGRSPNPESRTPNPDPLAVLSRWGLRTLGQLAALPPVELSERIGQTGLLWQRLARGEDPEPLVPTPEEETFEATTELEWPVEGLEPLSFVFSGLLEPLCRRLARRDRAVAVLHLRLRLVTRETHARSLQLPAPVRDPKVLRTLLLLDLESHPAPAGIDIVTVVIDPTPGRIVQESLLTRALPSPEQTSTLLARLRALMGDGRCGSPALVDSHRPGAFAMTPFAVIDEPRATGDASLSRPLSQAVGVSLQNASQGPKSAWGDEVGPRAFADGTPEMRFAGLCERAGEREEAPVAALRRFRLPVPARVLIDQGRPLTVRTERQGLSGGRVQASAGPWRTSGEWWKAAGPRGASELEGLTGRTGWNRDEWDVALSDGGVYRIFEDRDSGRWFVDAIVD